jgi:hypothetical protein
MKAVSFGAMLLILTCLSFGLVLSGCGCGDDDDDDSGGGASYGACCEENQCSVKTYEDCAGAWQGPDTDCEPNPCEADDDDTGDDDTSVDDDTSDDDTSDDDDDAGLFHKKISDPFERPWDMAYSVADGTLLTSYDGFFTTYLKVDDNAEIVWTHRFDVDASVALNNSIPIPGEGDTLIHIGADESKIYLWQTDSFVFDWGKSYDYDTDLFPPTLSYLLFGTRFTDGKIAIVGATEIPTYGGFALDGAPMVTLTDDGGGLVWSKQYYIEGWYFIPKFLMEREDAFVLVGEAYTMTPTLTSTTKAGLVIVDKTTGNAVGDAQFYGVDGDLVPTGISSGGNYLSGYAFLPWDDSFLQGFVMKLSDSGAPLAQATKAFISDSFPFRIINCVEQIGENELVLGGTAMMENEMGGTAPGQFFTMKTDADLSNVAWSTVYSDKAESGEYLDVGDAYLCRTTPDDRLLFWGAFTQVNGIGYAIKASTEDGRSACLNEPIETSIQDLDVLYESSAITVSSGVLGNAQDHTVPDDTPDDWALDITTVCETGSN